MAVDLVWHFSSRQRAQDFLWALLSVGRASGWRRLVVAVDWREKVEVGISFDELLTEGRVEWVGRLLERSRHNGVTLEALVEDPWQWHELYLNGGVQAFRWWQGAGPGEVARPARGARRGPLPARHPGPGGAVWESPHTHRLIILDRDDRTIYTAVKKRGNRRGR